MSDEFVELAFQVLVAFPAKLFSRSDKKISVPRTVGVMAISAVSGLDGTVQVSTLNEFIDAAMAAQAKGIYLFFQQALQVTDMGVMTGVTLALLKREMDRCIGKALLELLMTLEAQFWNPRLGLG
jgi:hypothetical protein